MCGICGIYNYRTLKPVEADKVVRMYGTMRHRGPDDEGHYVDGALGLGHCRLSIIDTSSRGRQPMTNEDGSICLTFNGEVYNYIELREGLASKGYTFRTGTDTEVIIKMYQEYGETCLDHFVGMFAFVLWDKRERKLFLARDRLGKKPLYYTDTDDGIIFASEVKGILVAMEKKPTVDLYALDCYMSFGYVPGEHTTFKGIQKLLAGKCMTIKSGRREIREYWDLHFEEEEDRGEEYYVELLKEKLDDASRIRLRSDVPLGIFLSGGLDSSAVVALLAKGVEEPLKTFSVAYDKGSDFNETNYARLVAQKFRTDHHEFFVRPEEFREFIPRYVWHMDEPVTEAAAISLYFIAKLAREFVTVVLSGEGADEMFAGYPIYYYMNVLEMYRKVPSVVREKLINPILLLARREKLTKYVKLSSLPLSRRYLGVSLYEVDKKEDLYGEDFKEGLKGFDFLDVIRPFYKKVQDQPALNQMLYLDIKTWLVDDLLIKADKMSMAPSLELRVPFLDHRIAEFASRLPVKYKLRGRTTKYILKKAMKGILPRSIIYRSKKGFPTPLQSMFREELNRYAEELLTEQKSVQRGYFKPKMVSRILSEHKTGAADHHKIIWQLIVLEEWHRIFID